MDGGRGIKVCQEWQTFKPFYDWAIDKWKLGLQIDRIDNDSGYSPINCQFSSPKDNVNNRRTTTWIEAFGETKTIADWLIDDRCKAKRHNIVQRLRKGWDDEKAITTPPLT